MASINVRKETGKLYLDFRYRNVRCREQTNLSDTPANRKKLAVVLDKIQADILLGCFDYAKTFPNSFLLKKIQHVEGTLATKDACPTFEVFANIWFKEMEVQWRRSYTDTVRYVMVNRLLPHFGKQKVNAISKADLLAFRAELAKSRKKNGELLSHSHVNRHMKIMRIILAEAADRFEFSSPYRDIKLLKVPKSDIQPFSPEEINLILDNVRADFRDYFAVRFFTGMRTGEIDGLKWKYVDFAKRLIYIRETVVDGREEYTKNDFSQRDIQMSQPVFDAFKNMLQNTAHREYVFCTGKGTPLNHNAVTKRVWYPLLRHLGLPKRNPYQMRHTAGTLWLASGESPEWIAKQMGHSNTEMLFRVYSRYVPNLTRQDGSAADRMFNTIRNQKG
ncbi:Arm DNA-binding domain-containing protein [Neptunicella sp.]|uniref:Arm DNA-binding domain-containing protein n=1 Tax=Neptunicella sp. TaxID=2125986 RepID=UPI003F690F43